MKLNINYISSVVAGLFCGSLVLFISRLIGTPISGTIIAIILSAFIASFLYNPSKKKKNNHTSLRGASASVFFCLIYSIMLTIYYVPKLGSVFGTADISLSVSIAIVLAITVVGGLVIGSISGSIGSTFRDLITVYLAERK